ncbi:chromosome replication/partitioning protein [Borrelia sp. RT5S]|uniref:chromosome replication/partitioning protein n=1 Tax=Borrelia sp. RT5S TaxID=2898581 RepID=UPI001E29398A|nr:chromosome replication/partitioning protein [Borrelia sp. RT5S]UGQ16731.1 chromosome replication/partitioning protein [Borrelia sp. RT5S]
MKEIEVKFRARTDKQALKDMRNDLDMRFKTLMSKLAVLVIRDVENRIEIAKTLFEIHDEKLYIAGGFADFKAFVQASRISKSNVYNYIKIGKALKEGYITEQDIKEQGFHGRNLLLASGDDLKVEGEREIKKGAALRISMPSEDTYMYFKSNTKFASFILDTLCREKRALLDELLLRYNQGDMVDEKMKAVDIIETEPEENIEEISTR